jgi:tetratricopeptide (TPR) repeat protein
MKQHARKPAIFAILLTAGLGLAALSGSGVLARRGDAAGSMPQLELQIAAGKADAATWQHYGDALRDVKRYSHAAAAYRKALELEPDRREARVSAALVLGQAGDADGFFAMVQELSVSDPKLAVDVMDRPESAGPEGKLRKDGRWEGAYRNARAQAAD